MSDQRSPAIAIWEFASIAQGVNGADAIAKGAPIDLLYTGTTHPGKYVVLVSGDTASVEVAASIVEDFGADLIDSVFLPDIDPSVADAMVSDNAAAQTSAEAVGVVETRTVASGIDSADAAVKAADVSLAAVRIADGIDGKAYYIVEGTVGEVDAAVEAGVERAGEKLVAAVVIPLLTDDLRDDLAASTGFLDRLRSHRTEA